MHYLYSWGNRTNKLWLEIENVHSFRWLPIYYSTAWSFIYSDYKSWPVSVKNITAMAIYTWYIWWFGKMVQTWEDIRLENIASKTLSTFMFYFINSSIKNLYIRWDGQSTYDTYAAIDLYFSLGNTFENITINKSWMKSANNALLV